MSSGDKDGGVSSPSKSKGDDDDIPNDEVIENTYFDAGEDREKTAAGAAAVHNPPGQQKTIPVSADTEAYTTTKQVHITLVKPPSGISIDATFIEALYQAALTAECNGQDIDTEVERLRFINKAKSALITDIYRIQETSPGSGIKVLRPDEE